MSRPARILAAMQRGRHGAATSAVVAAVSPPAIHDASDVAGMTKGRTAGCPSPALRPCSPGVSRDLGGERERLARLATVAVASGDDERADDAEDGNGGEEDDDADHGGPFRNTLLAGRATDAPLHEFDISIVDPTTIQHKLTVLQRRCSIASWM